VDQVIELVDQDKNIHKNRESLRGAAEKRVHTRIFDLELQAPART
jgi:hypothetical protein